MLVTLLLCSESLAFGLEIVLWQWLRFDREEDARIRMAYEHLRDGLLVLALAEHLIDLCRPSPFLQGHLYGQQTLLATE